MMKEGGGPLWNGGFDEPMHPALRKISCGLGPDLPLADADLLASAAWAAALGRCGALSEADAQLLETTLLAMRSDLAAGRWNPSADDGIEDIHTAIEREVTRRAGEAGLKLHTGRSRNDQVATALRMALRERIDELIAASQDLQRTLALRAAEEIDTLLPAFTHMQPAQPVRLAHWLLSHVWPLARDTQRLREVRLRADVLPLGSGAATGAAWPVDREFLASRLDFAAVSQNSLDAVGDRDVAIEAVFACGMIGQHLSRLAEELVVWSSAAFQFVRWPDALATGSSLMPNKKNPDLAELVRGRGAAAIGDLVALLALVRSLPAGYQRDLQESKTPAWRTTEATRDSLEAMTAAIAGIRFDRERMLTALTDDLLATEAADALVARGIPFRSAHAAVARAVVLARQRGIALRSIPANDLPAPLEARDLEGLDFETAVERRTVIGGTARASVRAQLQRVRALLAVE